MRDIILDNLEVIQKKIKACCIQNHRDPKEVKLLLATKTVPPDRI